MKFLHRHAAFTMAIAASCAVLAGCDDNGNGIGFSDRATVRFVNALSGGSGSLALEADGSSVGSGVAYRNFGTCQSVTPGSTTFAFGESGSSTALATLPTQTLEAGTRYTVVATGSAATPTFMFLNDTHTTPPAGRARLRVINAVNASTPLDVYVSATGAPLGTANLTNVAFNNSNITTTFLDVPTGSTQVRVTEAGDLDLTVIGTSNAFTLDDGDVVTVVAVPSATVSGGVDLLLVPECP